MFIIFQYLLHQENIYLILEASQDVSILLMSDSTPRLASQCMHVERGRKLFITISFEDKVVRSLYAESSSVQS